MNNMNNKSNQPSYERPTSLDIVFPLFLCLGGIVHLAPRYRYTGHIISAILSTPCLIIRFISHNKLEYNIGKFGFILVRIEF